jgi:hypothetical protein
LRHHFACTQCKQVLRDKSSAGQVTYSFLNYILIFIFKKSGIVPSLTFTKDESTGIFTLFTHPWEGNSANHVCNGFSVDQSDAKLLLREKLNELRVNGGPPPKQAYAELLAVSPNIKHTVLNNKTLLIFRQLTRIQNGILQKRSESKQK